MNTTPRASAIGSITEAWPTDPTAQQIVAINQSLMALNKMIPNPMWRRYDDSPERKTMLILLRRLEALALIGAQP
jgi:hypothetical protein